MTVANYDEALSHLDYAERYAHSDPQTAGLAANARATLALVDAVETLTYLMYGEE